MATVYFPKFSRDTPSGIKTFNLEDVYWTPIEASAQALVLLNGRPYAGFDTDREAQEAVALWKAYWPAAQNYSFSVVKRR